jgi:hypothetical protein
LRVADDDVKVPRFVRFLANTPPSIIRLGLESEVALMRGWVDSLCSEPEPSGAGTPAQGSHRRKPPPRVDLLLPFARRPCVQMRKWLAMLILPAFPFAIAPALVVFAMVVPPIVVVAASRSSLSPETSARCHCGQQR